MFHMEHFFGGWTFRSACCACRADRNVRSLAMFHVKRRRPYNALMANRFRISSEFQPAGDQPQAIDQLVAGFRGSQSFQTLLGVTGSGKTFTMANVVAQLGKPALVMSHNKTLAAQ